MRWKKIVDADLYSKTPSHGIPVLRQNALKGDKVVSVPRFFSQTRSILDSTSQIKYSQASIAELQKQVRIGVSFFDQIEKDSLNLPKVKGRGRKGKDFRSLDVTVHEKCKLPPDEKSSPQTGLTSRDTNRSRNQSMS